MAKNKKSITDLIEREDNVERKLVKLEGRALMAVRKLASMARAEGDASARMWLKIIGRLV